MEVIVSEGAVGSIDNENYNIVTSKVNITNLGANSSEISTETYKALFTNYDSNDYSLLNGSTAIDFGTDSYGPSDDILGNGRDASPDAGAYEYQNGGGTFEKLMNLYKQRRRKDD